MHLCNALWLKLAPGLQSQPMQGLGFRVQHAAVTAKYGIDPTGSVQSAAACSCLLCKSVLSRAEEQQTERKTLPCVCMEEAQVV